MIKLNLIIWIINVELVRETSQVTFFEIWLPNLDFNQFCWSFLAYDRLIGILNYVFFGGHFKFW